VGDGEQEIAQLFMNRGVPSGAQGPTQLSSLLVEFTQEAPKIGPVESDPCDLRGDAQRLEQRGKRGRDSAEHRVMRLASPLLDLDLLPLLENLPGGPQSCFAEHVRVSSDNLVADGPHHVLDVELAALLRDTTLEDDLKEQVAELLTVRRGGARS